MAKDLALLCFAHGNADGWEAICVDLDIAVQGQSFDDVKSLLGTSVRSYVDAVMEEQPETRENLLNRRSPWHVTFALTARLIAFNLFRGRNREAQASFPVICPA